MIIKEQFQKTKHGSCSVILGKCIIIIQRTSTNIKEMNDMNEKINELLQNEINLRERVRGKSAKATNSKIS